MRRVHIAHIEEGVLTAAPDVAHYLRDVLRLADGARVVVFGGGAEADARVGIAGVGQDSTVTLTIATPRRAPPRRPLTLLYALAKGDKVDLVIRDATELGATEIVVFAAERSVVKLSDDRALRREGRWQKIAEEAARQSGRTDPPRVVGPLTFDAALRVQDAYKFILHPSAPAALADGLTAAIAEHGGIAIAVGPEGGFSSAELALAASHGFVAASFGTTTLRTETVPAAVLGAIAVLERDPKPTASSP